MHQSLHSFVSAGILRPHYVRAQAYLLETSQLRACQLPALSEAIGETPALIKLPVNCHHPKRPQVNAAKETLNKNPV